MFSAGQNRIDDTRLNDIVTYAEQNFCQGPFATNRRPPTPTPANTINNCKTSAGQEIRGAANELDEKQFLNFTKYLQYAGGQAQFRCEGETNIFKVGARQQHALAVRANGCMGQHGTANDQSPVARKISIRDGSQITYKPLAGNNGFIKWSIEMVKAGIPIQRWIQIPVPDFVKRAFADPLLNDEIIRIYKEAMGKRPVPDYTNPSVQNKIGTSIISQMQTAKQGKSNEEFLKYLVKTYVDYVIEVRGAIKVEMKQIPNSLPQRLAVNDLKTVGELRRLFAQVEDQIKENTPQVKTFLAGKDMNARDRMLNPVRDQIANKLVPPARPKLKSLAQYDAVAELTVNQTGDQVAVVKIELKRRVMPAAQGLVPQRLLDAAIEGAANDDEKLIRAGTVTRFWGEITKKAPEVNSPLDENKNPLRKGIINNLIEQIRPMDTDTLSRQRVVDVDKPNKRVILKATPEGYLKVIKKVEKGAGARDSRNHGIRIYGEAEDKAKNKGILVDENKLGDDLGKKVFDILEGYDGIPNLAGIRVKDVNVKKDSEGKDYYDIELEIIGGPTGGGGIPPRPIGDKGWKVSATGEVESQGIYNFGTRQDLSGYVGGDFKLILGNGDTKGKVNLFARLNVIGFGYPDSWTDRTGMPFQLSEGSATALRIQSAQAGVRVFTSDKNANGDKGSVTGAVGIDTARLGSKNPVYDTAWNPSAGLFPTPTNRPSTFVGAKVSVEHPIGDVMVIGATAIAGKSIRATLLQAKDEENPPEYVKDAIYGGQVSIAGATTKKSRVRLSLSGFKPGLLIADGGFVYGDQEKKDDTVVALGVRFAHEWTTQPAGTDQVYAGALGIFPIKGGTFAPFVHLGYLWKGGDATYGGVPVDDGCASTNLSGECSTSTVGVSYSGPTLDFGLRIMPFDAQFQIILGGNITYNTNISSATGGPRLALKYEF